MKLTQMDVASILGVTQASVSRWTKGVVPDQPYALLLADALDLDFDWLMYGNGRAPSERHDLQFIEIGVRGSLIRYYKNYEEWLRLELKLHGRKMTATERSEWQRAIRACQKKLKGCQGLVEFLEAFKPETAKQRGAFKKYFAKYFEVLLSEVEAEVESDTLKHVPRLRGR
jgi:transcriptional regulator with XRE-family HTH domain